MISSLAHGRHGGKMLLNAKLYDNDRLVGEGVCSLHPAHQPESGMFVYSSQQPVPTSEALTLKLSDGRTYHVTTTRVNAAAGSPPSLAFDVSKQIA
jgi:hypothetical protein